MCKQQPELGQKLLRLTAALLALMCAVLLGFFSQPADAACALRSSTYASTTTEVATLASDTDGGSTVDVVTGDALLVGFKTYSAQPVSSIADTAGNSFSQVSGSPFEAVTSSGAYLYLYYVKNATGNSSDVVTVDVSGGDVYLSMIVLDFSGANTSSLFDGTTASWTESMYYEANHPGGSITTSDTGSCVAQIYISTNGGNSITYTAGSGYTLGPNFNNSTSEDTGNAEYIANASTGSHTAGFSSSNYIEGGGWIFGIAAASSTCTHEGYTSAGALATPNGSSGSYVGSAGAFVTPNCSSTSYWQPTVGNFGVN